MKSTSVILVLLVVLGIYVFIEKFAKFNYEGAKEPGHAYPEEVQKDFNSSCVSSFKAGREGQSSKMFRITDEQIDELCACSLERMEDALSYKEYDEIESKVKVGFGAGMAAQLPRKVRHIFNGCANEIGFEIQGAFF